MAKTSGNIKLEISPYSAFYNSYQGGFLIESHVNIIDGNHFISIGTINSGPDFEKVLEDALKNPENQSFEYIDNSDSGLDTVYISLDIDHNLSSCCEVAYSGSS